MFNYSKILKLTIRNLSMKLARKKINYFALEIFRNVTFLYLVHLRLLLYSIHYDIFGKSTHFFKYVHLNLIVRNERKEIDARIRHNHYKYTLPFTLSVSILKYIRNCNVLPQYDPIPFSLVFQFFFRVTCYEVKHANSQPRKCKAVFNYNKLQI